MGAKRRVKQAASRENIRKDAKARRQRQQRARREAGLPPIGNTNVGRPSEFNSQTVLEICKRMSDGESLIQICRDPSMPSAGTVRKWRLVNPEFATMFGEARQLLIEHYRDELIAIADDSRVDDVPRSKLRIDTRQWIVTRLLPGHNDKLDLSIAGPNGNPIPIATMTSEDAARAYMNMIKDEDK